MKAAADASDPDALNFYIDYPALREDLKSEITVEMIAKAENKNPPLAVSVSESEQR